MSALSQAREDVAQRLRNAGFAQVLTEIPDRVPAPPLTFVTPGEPWLTGEGCNFGEHRVGLTIVLIAGKGTSKKTAEQLDRMVEDATVALYADGIGGNVGRPGQISLNGTTYTAVAMDAAVPIRL